MKCMPQRFGRLTRLVTLAGMALVMSPLVAGAAVEAGEENTSNVSQPVAPRSTGRSLLHRQNGGFRSGLSGVKSAAPRPIKSLGGVKAKLPRPIANRGSLLPPSPVRPPSDDRAGRGSVRDIPGARFPNDAFRRGRRDGRNVGGTGISGSFRDDDFQLRFNLGNDVLNPFRDRGRRDRRDHDRRDRHHDHHDGHHHNTIVWPWWYGYGYGWYDRYDYYPPQTVTSSPVYVDPSMLGLQQQSMQPQTLPEPPTDEELADWAMYEGRLDDAIGAYREHLAANADDGDAMRRLALALVMDRKVKEGVALLALAYEKDPSLARRPMTADLLPDGERDLHEVLLAVVPFANRMKSASGYLAVTAIMQAQNREALALKILERAKNAGLEEKLTSELEAELGG